MGGCGGEMVYLFINSRGINEYTLVFRSINHNFKCIYLDLKISLLGTYPVIICIPDICEMMFIILKFLSWEISNIQNKREREKNRKYNELWYTYPPASTIINSVTFLAVLSPYNFKQIPVTI